jgi:hypothetical protein
MTKQKLSEYLLFCLCLISTADSVVIFGAEHSLIGHRNARAVFISNSSMPLPPISGYLDGNEIMKPSGPSQTGYVVRYTSDHCGYCKRDESAWLELAHVFQERGLSIVDVVPRSEDAHVFGHGAFTDFPEISFVSTAWLERVRFDVTPSIVVVSGHGTVLWSHKGTLTSDDIAAATRVVTRGTR